jgi:hypothetical protein
MKTITILLLLLLPVTAMNSVMSSSEPLGAELILTTEERVVQVLRDSGYSREMQRIILAQAKHESGGFTNSLTRKHNNLFGMLHPRSRPTLSLDGSAWAEGRVGYARYESLEASVGDYLLYKKFVNAEDKPDAKSYIYQLKRLGYFTDNAGNYLGGVKRYMRGDSTVRNFSPN